MSGLRLGELCAGYGGLGMAVEEVFNAETAWFSEFDAAPSKILAHRWPEVPNYGDMTKIDWAAIEHVDIISGGTPCQDLSAAGKRAGMTEGTRSNLWVQMREAVAVQRPRYVVWENVRGAYSAEASSDLEFCPGCMGSPADRGTVLRALGRVLGDLSDLGYDTQWRGLRAADVGACHGRFRVFVLAIDASRFGRREGHLPAGVGTTSVDRSALSDESNPGRVRLEFAADSTGARRAEGQNAGAGVCHACQRPWGVELERGDGEPATPDALRFGQREHTGESSAEEARAGSGDEPADHHGVQHAIDWGPYGAGIARWESVMGRRAPAPTEPAGKDGAHRLSPRFTEWMMGLPDGWVTDPAIGITRNEQLKACGNGVVPQQAMAALRDMLAAFQTVEVAA